MQKRVSFYVVSLLSVALIMVAGCANHEAVKKDEGITPAPVTKPVEQAKSGVPSPKQEAATAGQSAIQPVSSQKASPSSQLQSALEKIYFDFDSASLSESARGTLTKNAEALMKASSAKIRIEGNCDDRGSAEYNMALGERRAKSAQQYLGTLGVKTDRISTISYGKEKPAVQGSDESAWAKNRRDEFIVVIP
jgi:peptidoglycan-associated lipoprotein